MSLEQDLRHAFRRKDPTSGFDDRVLSRIAAGPSTRLRARETVRIPQTRTRWVRYSLPIAASLMLAAGVGYYAQYQQHQQAVVREQQAYTERAAREVVLALQIASETVSAAQAKVEEITRYEPTNDY